MSSELEFSRKPRRMTSPPQNRGKWLPGYSGVEVLMETDPARMAYFAREATWGDIMREPTHNDLDDTLAEVAGGKVLGAAFKGGFGFRIRASRSSMDQMLRLAEGSGGAGSGAGAQTTRDNDQRDFNIIVPNTIESLAHEKILAGVGTNDDGEPVIGGELYSRASRLITEMRAVYGALVDAGVPPQDARYVALPLGFQTQWFHVMSLGNMIKMCEQRMCNGLTQHETNYLVRVMRDLVVTEHPWMADNLRSGCEKRGQCAARTMLFPPCGAFVSGIMSKRLHTEPQMQENEVRKRLSEYDPDRHLYSAEQNDAMQFAQWDIKRKKLEHEQPEAVFSMAGPPKFLGFRQVKP